MFGYVLPQKPELRVREWYAYRAYYCGLCKELAREYGFLSRLFLNYDMVLPALLADSLAGFEAHACPQRCIVNPVKRPMCASTPGLALAADALVLTVWYKLADDLADERALRRLPALALRPFLARMHRKAAARRPALDETMRAQMQAQAALETRGSASADEAADPTARMTAALFAAAGGKGAHILERLGLFIGKIIYYLDAAEDYEKDRASGAYNVFLRQGLSREDTVLQAQRLCRLCAGEAALCYNLLEPQREKGLLDNIIFLGLAQSIALAGQKRPKPRAQE